MIYTSCLHLKYMSWTKAIYWLYTISNIGPICDPRSINMATYWSWIIINVQNNWKCNFRKVVCALYWTKCISREWINFKSTDTGSQRFYYV